MRGRGDSRRLGEDLRYHFRGQRRASFPAAAADASGQQVVVRLVICQSVSQSVNNVFPSFCFVSKSYQNQKVASSMLPPVGAAPAITPRKSGTRCARSSSAPGSYPQSRSAAAGATATSAPQPLLPLLSSSSESPQSFFR